MRIAYVSEHRLPTEKAHGQQIAQVCKALLQLGHTATIIAPFRTNSIAESFWDYYHAPTEIELVTLGAKDYVQSGLPKLLGFYVQMKAYSRLLTRYVQHTNFDAFYTRSFRVAALFAHLQKPLILELHSIPKRRQRIVARCCNKSTLIITLTNATKQQLIQMGVEPAKIIVEPDAVDLEQYLHLPTKAEAQTTLNQQTNRIIVGYVGRLTTMGMDKGVADLLKALKQLQSTKQYMGLIVGGPEQDVQEYKTLANTLGLTEQDVVFTGAIPHEDVPTALAACDILAMPWPDKPHYRHHMSPLKMFEYMATKRPILTGDLPTIREVLTDETAFFCEPDNAESITEQLKWIRTNPNIATRKTEAAFELVQHYTWKKRTKRILQQL